MFWFTFSPFCTKSVSSTNPIDAHCSIWLFDLSSYFTPKPSFSILLIIIYETSLLWIHSDFDSMVSRVCVTTSSG